MNAIPFILIPLSKSLYYIPLSLWTQTQLMRQHFQDTGSAGVYFMVPITME
jgi:hypothetical protein